MYLHHFCASFIVYLFLQPFMCDCVPELDNLYNYTFNGYNKKTFPDENINETVNVGFEFSISSINAFDEKSGELSVSMRFTLMWTDQRLRWNATAYGGVSSVLFEENDMWTPQIYILESSDRMLKVGHSGLLRVLNNGDIFWTTAAVLKIACSVDVAYFPFDVQVCDIRVSGWTYLPTEVFLNTTSAVLDRSFFTRNSQWELLKSPVDNCVLGTSSSGGPSCVQLKLTMRRRRDFYIVYIITPIGLLGLVNLFVFMMPVSTGERISVAMTIFLSFVVFMGSVNNIVPESSSPISYIYYYLLFLLVYSSTIMFLCIMSLRIYDKACKVPASLKKAYYYCSFGWLASRKKQTKPLSSPDSHGDSNSEMGDHVGDDSKAYGYITWRKIGKAFDKFCFFIMISTYTGFSMFLFREIYSKRV